MSSDSDSEGEKAMMDKLKKMDPKAFDKFIKNVRKEKRQMAQEATGDENPKRKKTGEHSNTASSSNKTEKKTEKKKRATAKAPPKKVNRKQQQKQKDCNMNGTNEDDKKNQSADNMGTSKGVEVDKPEEKSEQQNEIEVLDHLDTPNPPADIHLTKTIIHKHKHPIVKKEEDTDEELLDKSKESTPNNKTTVDEKLHDVGNSSSSKLLRKKIDVHTNSSRESSTESLRAEATMRCSSSSNTTTAADHHHQPFSFLCNTAKAYEKAGGLLPKIGQKAEEMQESMLRRLQQEFGSSSVLPTMVVGGTVNKSSNTNSSGKTAELCSSSTANTNTVGGEKENSPMTTKCLSEIFPDIDFEGLLKYINEISPPFPTLNAMNLDELIQRKFELKVQLANVDKSLWLAMKKCIDAMSAANVMITEDDEK